MMAELFVELTADTRVMGFGMQVERRFEQDEDGRGGPRELKVELATFEDALGRTEEKDSVLDDWPAQLRAGVPPHEERNRPVYALPGIRKSHTVISMKK